MANKYMNPNVDKDDWEDDDYVDYCSDLDDEYDDDDEEFELNAAACNDYILGNYEDSEMVELIAEYSCRGRSYVPRTKAELKDYICDLIDTWHRMN